MSSGASLVLLRAGPRDSGGRWLEIAYAGGTAWPQSLAAAADGADLLIAEAYYCDKPVPCHLCYADLVTHQASPASRRVIITYMSTAMLARAGQGQLAFETARDGLVVQL